MKKYLIITISFWVSIGYLKAQQDAMFTHYMFNTLAVNPAYAGSREALTLTGLTRHQWVNFEGAPSTQTLTAHTPIHTENLGLGLSIIRDKIGPVNMTSLYGDFVYRVKAGNGKLAMGLKGGLNIMQAALTSLKTEEQGDAVFQQNIQSALLPNFGLGLYYYQDRYYVGLSAPKLLENNFLDNSTSGGSSLATEKRHYFFIAGYVMDLNQDVKFKPTLLTKMVQNAPIEIDLTAQFLFYEKFNIGAMYRSQDGIGALIGYQFTEQFRMGYSYDYPLTKLRTYQSGTHEIMLSYDFIFNNIGKIKSPRYF